MAAIEYPGCPYLETGVLAWVTLYCLPRICRVHQYDIRRTPHLRMLTASFMHAREISVFTASPSWPVTNDIIVMLKHGQI
jgi:hypothetical protein